MVASEAIHPVFSCPAETRGPLRGAPGRGPAHALHCESCVLSLAGCCSGLSGLGLLWLAPGACSGLDALSSQDSQCGTVIDVSIDCAVKLIGTNCIIYPVSSKDLQHIWVSSCRFSRSSGPLVSSWNMSATPSQVRRPGTGSSRCPGARLLLPGSKPFRPELRTRPHVSNPSTGCRCDSLDLVSLLL